MIIRGIKEQMGILAGQMYSELFECQIDVMLQSDDTDYAEKCAEYFNNMPGELINNLKKYTLRYCEDFRQFFDKDSPEIPEGITENEILSYVSPHVLIIDVSKDSGQIAFGVEFGCEWEPEHGMEWTVRNGSVLYVGDFVNMSPWYDNSVYQKQGLNYVFRAHCI